MANPQNQTEGQNGNVQEQRGEQAGVGSPITNEAYNVITALQAKLEGLEAYRKYQKDGGDKIWRELTQIELEGVQKLCDQLEQLVKDGKFRLKTPGKANG
jgi:hypothetical protein